MVARVTCCNIYMKIWSGAPSRLYLSRPFYSATRRPFGAELPVFRVRVHSVFFHRNERERPHLPSSFTVTPSPSRYRRGPRGKEEPLVARGGQPRRAEGRAAEAGESCVRLRAQLTARTNGARDTMGGRNRRRCPSVTDASSVSLDGIL